MAFDPKYDQIVPLAVKPCESDGYRIWVEFNDGSSGEVDLSDLAVRPHFGKWADRDFFESVRIEHGLIVWDEDTDINPDGIYLRLNGLTWADIQPPPRLRLSLVEMEDREGNTVWVKFSDGTEGEVDLTPHLPSDFRTCREYRIFRRKGAIAPWGDVIWEDEIEISGDALYEEITGTSLKDALARMEQSCLASPN